MSYLPFAWIGAAVFAAASAAAVLDPHVTGVLSLVCGGSAFLCLILALLLGRWGRRRGRRVMLHAALLFLSSGTMLALYADRYNRAALPVQGLDGATASARMEVLDYPQRQYGRFYYSVRVLELDGEAVAPFQARFSSPEALECEPCGQVVCGVGFRLFDDGGMYGARSSQLAHGNLIGAYAQGFGGYEYIESSDPLPAGRLLPLIRRTAARALDRCLSSDEAGLLKAVLLGQSSELDEGIRTDFRIAGCSHILAVSGLHMTLCGSFLTLLLAGLPVPRRLRSLLALLPLFFYLLLTGFPVSAVRSYVMFAICSLGSALYQAGDTLNSLGAAVTLICFADPFSGGSAGFALSVLATAGIAVLGRPLEELLCPGSRGRLWRYMAGSVSTSLSASLFTLPIQAAVFQGLPLLTLLTNLLVMPLFIAALYSGIPLLLLSLLDPSGALLQPFALLCGLLCRLLIRLCRWIAGLPGAYLSLTDPVLLLSLTLALLAALVLRLRSARLRRGLLALTLALALALPAFRYVQRTGTVTLAVSGDGESACVVALEDGRAAVLSSGTYKSGLARQIISQENAYALESVLVSGRDQKSQAMLRDLMSGCRPETLWLYGRSYSGKDLSRPDVRLEAVPEDGLYPALPGVIVQVADGGAKLRIWANGRKLVLALADCPGESCDLLMTGLSLPQMDAPLTLFMCGEGLSPEEAALTLHSDFSLVTDQRVTYVDISPEGEISLRSW